MLRPMTNTQLAQTHVKAEKQKENILAQNQNTVTGQVTSSVLDDFINTSELNENIPDAAQEGASLEVLDVIVETVVASTSQLDETVGIGTCTPD